MRFLTIVLASISLLVGACATTGGGPADLQINLKADVNNFFANHIYVFCDQPAGRWEENIWPLSKGHTYKEEVDLRNGTCQTVYFVVTTQYRRWVTGPYPVYADATYLLSINPDLDTGGVLVFDD